MLGVWGGGTLRAPLSGTFLQTARFRSYVTEGVLFTDLRAAVHRRGQRPPKGRSGTDETVEATSVAPKHARKHEAHPPRVIKREKKSSLKRSSIKHTPSTAFRHLRRLDVVNQFLEFECCNVATKIVSVLWWAAVRAILFINCRAKSPASTNHCLKRKEIESKPPAGKRTNQLTENVLSTL